MLFSEIFPIFKSQMSYFLYRILSLHKFSLESASVSVSIINTNMKYIAQNCNQNCNNAVYRRSVYKISAII